MNTFLKQLIQWPPTSTTVTGLSILAGMGSYFATGSWEVAATVAGFAHVILPQQAGAIAQGVADAEVIVRDVENGGTKNA